MNIEIADAAGFTQKSKKPLSAIKRRSIEKERPPFTLYGKTGKTRRKSSKKRQPSKYRQRIRHMYNEYVEKGDELLDFAERSEAKKK